MLSSAAQYCSEISITRASTDRNSPTIGLCRPNWLHLCDSVVGIVVICEARIDRNFTRNLLFRLYVKLYPNKIDKRLMSSTLRFLLWEFIFERYLSFTLFAGWHFHHHIRSPITARSCHQERMSACTQHTHSHKRQTLETSWTTISPNNTIFECS